MCGGACRPMHRPLATILGLFLLSFPATGTEPAEPAEAEVVVEALDEDLLFVTADYAGRVFAADGDERTRLLDALAARSVNSTSRSLPPELQFGCVIMVDGVDA